MNPSEKRLAVLVEDHPLEYFDFEGIIPKGHYGAGEVVIWDRGTYELIEQKEDKIIFVLKGEKLKGVFILTRFKGKKKEWLLIKKKDECANPGWKLEKCLTPDKKTQLKELIPLCESS